MFTSYIFVVIIMSIVVLLSTTYLANDTALADAKEKNTNKKKREEFEKMFVLLANPRTEFNQKVDSLYEIINHTEFYNTHQDIIIDYINSLNDGIEDQRLLNLFVLNKMQQELEPLGITIKYYSQENQSI